MGCMEKPLFLGKSGLERGLFSPWDESKEGKGLWGGAADPIVPQGKEEDQWEHGERVL